MASISKRASGAWQNTSYGIRGTATDTITTLPTTIYSDGTNATVSIKGNTTQSGTPTPDSPIMPQGCGVMTANLADLYEVNKTVLQLTFRTADNMKIVIDGTKGSGANVISIKVPNITVPAGIYTVKIKMTSGSITGLTSDGVFFGINASTYGQRTAPAVTQIGEVGTRTFTLSEDTTITSFDITPSYSSEGAVFDNATFECWFYAGSNDIPYEPFGVKIPISSARQTNNIYLGEVPTTREIKKLVLDGTEDWIKSTTYQGSFCSPQVLINCALQGLICTHAEYTPVINATEYIYGKCAEEGSTVNKTLNLYLGDSSWTAADFKSYLAAQYAAGTPVTLWYVLATETTGIVNEPLMRIGDYADEVSGVSIPTTDGANALSVDTTVQPSEVVINYHGWHMGTVHERTAGQWD